jgi:hypothetical protein
LIMFCSRFRTSRDVLLARPLHREATPTSVKRFLLRSIS